jgi:nickel transport protein
MKHNRTTILVLVIILILPALLYAHGVTGMVQAGGLVVTAQYDTGEAMSYAKVSIAAPNAKLPFQSGRTDRNGRFCFFPDTAGHRLEVNAPVDAAMNLETNPAAERSKRSLSKYEKALIGIAVIFGVSGFFFWRMGMRNRKKSVEA